MDDGGKSTLAGLAISLMRHSATGCQFSRRRVAVFLRSSARFQSGVFAHSFCNSPVGGAALGKKGQECIT